MPRSAAALRDHAPAQRLQVLEQKLTILAQGPSRTRRNPALDVLTGRVPDERLHALQSSMLMRHMPPAPADLRTESASPVQRRSEPATMVLPVAAVRMAAVARSQHPAPSPWLTSTTGDAQPRLRLIAPPQPRWSRLPLVGPVVNWLVTEYRAYRWTGRFNLAL